ncbi:MAG: hypothetical protein ACT6Q7_03025 [Blastomonas fulva]|uniref:hypothetical protein n=1 Tax=Blastomonas fulva TaxID=1550728 RepID=UPI00403481C2
MTDQTERERVVAMIRQLEREYDQQGDIDRASLASVIADRVERGDHIPMTDTPEAVAQAMAESVGLLWEALPDQHDMVCGHGMPEGCKQYWRDLASIAPRPDADIVRQLVEAWGKIADGLRVDGRGNGPNHGHQIAGIWDIDNGDKAGTECQWCKDWNAALDTLTAASAAGYGGQ